MTKVASVAITGRRTTAPGVLHSVSTHDSQQCADNRVQRGPELSLSPEEHNDELCGGEALCPSLLLSASRAAGAIRGREAQADVGAGVRQEGEERREAPHLRRESDRGGEKQRQRVRPVEWRQRRGPAVPSGSPNVCSRAERLAGRQEAVPQRAQRAHQNLLQGGPLPRPHGRAGHRCALHSGGRLRAPKQRRQSCAEGEKRPRLEDQRTMSPATAAGPPAKSTVRRATPTKRECTIARHGRAGAVAAEALSERRTDCGEWCPPGPVRGRERLEQRHDAAGDGAGRAREARGAALWGLREPAEEAVAA